MDIQLFATEAGRLLFGAFATFAAILLWSRTRDMAWTFIIIATILSYAGILYANLLRFGILESDVASYAGIPLARIALEILPLLCLGVGFLIVLSRRRRP
jgi:ABC-type Fe3+-siderophore transport system permease subunit